MEETGGGSADGYGNQGALRPRQWGKRRHGPGSCADAGRRRRRSRHQCAARRGSSPRRRSCAGRTGSGRPGRRRSRYGGRSGPHPRGLPGARHLRRHLLAAAHDTAPDHRAAIKPADWQAALDTGLMSPVGPHPGGAARHGAPASACIVNIASIAAKYPLELRILSGAPRVAGELHRGRGPSRGRRQRHAQHRAAGHVPHRLRARAVHGECPAQWHELRAGAYGVTEAYQIPAKRFGDPRDVGSLVAWLCSAVGR